MERNETHKMPAVSGYDRLVWRINGTILLLLCVSGLFFGIWGVWKLFRELDRTPAHDLTTVNAVTKQEEFLRLGYFRTLEGTSFFLVELSAEAKARSKLSSLSEYDRSGSPARNYLLFDSRTKASQWLWDGHTAQIYNEWFVHDKVRTEKSRAVTGILFQEVTGDLNGDGKRNLEDPSRLQYFNLATKRLMPVAEGVDRVIGVEQTSPDEVLLFLSRKGASVFVSFNPKTMALGGEKVIGAL